MDEGRIPINEGIDLKQLVTEGCTWSVNFDETAKAEETSYANSDLLNFTQATDLYDDDCYTPGAGFDTLEGFEDIFDNGKIKKKIIRDGYGPTPAEDSNVTIQYNAFLDYGDEPFDSTYIRNSPFKFNLNDGTVVPGLNIGVSTMKLNERSQFLVHYDYAYGKMGCLDRIPPEATILYEVELNNILKIGATMTYPELDRDAQKEFKNAYEYALQACTKGNEFFKQTLYKQATLEYNRGISALQYAVMKDYSEQEKQQILLLRMLTNLAVTHVKRGLAKKACTACNEIFQMVKGTSLQVPPKIYYNNGKALMMLNDLKMAEKRLKYAQKLRPYDEDISKELIKLNELMKEEKERNIRIGVGLVQGSSSSSKKDASSTSKTSGEDCPGIIDDEFVKCIDDFCKELVEDQDRSEQVLPDGLKENELKYIGDVAKKYSLQFEERTGQDGKKAYFVKKN